MKKVLVIVAAGMVVLAAAAPGQAWGKGKAKAGAGPAISAPGQCPTSAPVEGSTPAATAASGQSAPGRDEKQLLINNFAALQNQQARVVVLQQLLSRETADLRSMEAVFCDQYKLDPEKWRKGQYRYDEKAGKFAEQPAAVK